MSFLQKLFKKKPRPDEVELRPVFDLGDKPFESNIIREGDPEYDFLKSVMDSDEPVIVNRRDDGLWEKEEDHA